MSPRVRRLITVICFFAVAVLVVLQIREESTPSTRAPYDHRAEWDDHVGRTRA